MISDMLMLERTEAQNKIGELERTKVTLGNCFKYSITICLS